MHGTLFALLALMGIGCINNAATETDVPTDDGLTCGQGTHEEDGSCVADETTGGDLDDDSIDDDWDVVIPYGDALLVDWMLLPSNDPDELYFVGERATDSWCETDIEVEYYDEQFAVVFFPGYIRFEEDYVYGTVRRIDDNGVCDDTDDYSDWAYLDEWFGADPTICVNVEDEDRYALLIGFDRDGNLINLLDCSAGNSPADSGNDEDDDGDVAGGVDGDESEGETGTDDDGDGFTSIETGGSDCNDGWYYTYPGAPEYNDDEDNDCDGTEDEGCSGVPVNGLCS